MTEQIIGVAKAYKTGKPDSTVIVIPKDAGNYQGQKFLVKKDNKGRIIYEPIKKEA